MSAPYRDRQDAGRRLAARLRDLHGDEDVQVLALPRGGVPVAAEVAHELERPLDLLVVAKMGAPGQEEVALGAVGPGGVKVTSHALRKHFRLPPRAFDALAQEAGREVERREQAYRGTHRPPDIEGRTVLVIDDGLATGSSMRAAVAAVRALGARRVVVAVPVGSVDACKLLEDEADDVRCLLVPDFLQSVGEWYEDFEQVSDAEVQAFMDRLASPSPSRRQ